MQIAPLVNISEAVELLDSMDLPHSDLAEQGPALFGIHVNNSLVALAGIEHHGAIGLLRSVAVVPSHRSQGIASRLIDFSEQSAKRRSIKALYLLTNSAEGFFTRHGYEVITRAETPIEIQLTCQFKALCPASASVMRKRLV